MRIIPVLDVLNGVVVRGLGGRRSEYRPIVSQLTSSVDPVEVARVLIAKVQPTELYLADLDAIAGAPPAVAMYRAVRAPGVRLWVDAGIADVSGARRIADAGCDVVAGLETIASACDLRDIVKAVGNDCVLFSFDLHDGVPLREWAGPLAEKAIACGITRLIVLDLARVGGAGTGTADMCREIADRHPDLEVIAGGGIAGPKDLLQLESSGVRAALVASALHDGRIDTMAIVRRTDVSDTA